MALLSLPVTSRAAEQSLRKFYFHHFGTSEGLSNGNVNDLFRDRAGLLWVGTYNGLNCFDGARFRAWKANPYDPQALPNSVVHGVCEDTLGHIWCITEAGVSRFDRGKFKNYKLIDAKTGKQESYGNWKVLCTHSGDIYALTNAGVFGYVAQADSFRQYSTALPDGSLRFAAVYKNTFSLDTRQNGLWFGTDKGVIFFDLATHQYHDRYHNPHQWNVFNHHDVSPLTLDSAGRLVFNDVKARELVTWNPATNARTAMSTKMWTDNREYLSTVFVDSKGNQWISTWAPSLYFIEASTGHIFRFRHDPKDEYSVSGNFFWDVHEDADGTIYLGTVDGLSITNLSRSFFSILQLPDTIDHRTFYFGSLFLGEDKQNHLWFTPSFEYLLRYDMANETFERMDLFPAEPKGTPDGPRYIQSMQATADTIYFGTTRGLYVFDVERGTFAPLPGVPDSIVPLLKEMKSLELTRDGTLWGAIHRVGLLRYDTHHKTFKLYRHDPKDPHSFSDGLVTKLEEDSSGEFWICTANDGPFKYDRFQDRFEYFPDSVRRRLGTGMISSVRDNTGKFWIMDNVNGLMRYDPQTQVVEANIAHDLLSYNAYGYLTIDGNQQIWLTFYNDFSILDTRNLSVENFRIMHSRENIKWWNYLTTLSDGRIVSESRNAVIIFDPRVRRTTNMLDPLTITNLVAGDTTIPFLEDGMAVELRYWQNHFSIDFGTLGMAKDAGLKFEYKLDGFDDEWVKCGSRRTAYYTNVPGGHYRFHVRMADPNGHWRESKQVVAIHVGKIFYKTTVFRVLLVLLLIAVVVGWAVSRKRRNAKKDNDRAINYFANSRFGSNHVEDILWDITNNVISLTDLVDCVIYLVDPKGAVLNKAAAFGEKEAVQHAATNPLQIPMGMGVVGRTAQTMEPIIIPDTQKIDYYIPSQMQGRSELAVPIVHDGRVLGVIDAEHPRKNFFRKSHLDLLTTIASISSSKIANAQKASEIEEKERKLHELQIQVSETRQLALRAQMNPHFIFNCLNSINSFILDNNADTASTYLIKFAKLIRLILENSNSKFIPLKSELDALKLYIEMESLRFETKFDWSIIVDEDVATHHVTVPPLILQPYVENAIWHGLLHKDGHGELVVELKQDENALSCTITDNGVGRAAAKQFKEGSLTQKQSLGMKLTQERLDLMNQQGEKKFKVEILDLHDAAGNPVGTQVKLEMEISE